MGKLLALLLLTSTSTALATETVDRTETVNPTEALNRTALQRLVHQDCGSCHGLLLKGGLGPDLRAENINHYDRDGLMGVILDGVDGTAMPPWRPLISQAEAAWIAEYLLKGNYQ